MSAAEEETQALRQLQDQFRTAKIDIDGATGAVNDWAAAIQAQTRFSDGEALAALGRAVAKTKDLAESQKLVELAMNIAVASSRDFNGVLDTLASAAGGSNRGLTSLRAEFGAQVGGANNAKQALDALGAAYPDNARKANELTDAMAKAKNGLGEAGEAIGKDLLPHLASLANAVATITPFLSKIVEGVKFVFAATGLEIANIAARVFESVAGFGATMKAALTGHLSEALAIVRDTNTKMQALSQAHEEEMSKLRLATEKKLTEIESQAAAAKKKLATDLTNHKVAETQKEEQEKIKELDKSLQFEEKREQQALAVKNQTSEQRTQIVRDSFEREKEIVRQGLEDGVLDAHQAAQRFEEIEQRKAARLLEINQKYVSDVTAELEGWLHKSMDVDAAFARAGMTAADSTASAFGNAAAKMTLHGKSFQQTFSAGFDQVKERFLSDVAAMIAKWLVLKAISAVVPGGGALGGLLGAATGLRVEGPTPVLMGEAGEGETAVPDSQALGFARGVMAGHKGSAGGAPGLPGTGGGGGGGGGVSLHIGAINISQAQLGDPAAVRQTAQQLAEFLAQETDDAIRFARRSSDLATKHSERAA